MVKRGSGNFTHAHTPFKNCSLIQETKAIQDSSSSETMPPHSKSMKKKTFFFQMNKISPSKHETH